MFSAPFFFLKQLLFVFFPPLFSFLFFFFCCCCCCCFCCCCLQAELVSTCFVLLLQCCVQYERTSTKLNPSACRFSQYLLLSNYLYSFFVFIFKRQKTGKEKIIQCAFKFHGHLQARFKKKKKKNRQARPTLFFSCLYFSLSLSPFFLPLLLSFFLCFKIS